MKKALVVFLSVALVASLLVVSASAQFVTGSGATGLPAANAKAYALPFTLEYIRSSNDDSQAPALGGTLNTYHSPAYWPAGTSGNTATVGGGYGSFNQTSYTWSVANIGLARISFPMLSVTAMDYADYMPEVNYNLDPLVNSPQLAMELRADIRAMYQTGYIESFTTITTRNVGSGNINQTLQPQWDAAVALARNATIAQTQGDVVALEVSFTFTPFQENNADSTRFDGHTSMWLSITNDDADPINYTEYQRLTDPRTYKIEVPVLDDSGSWFDWFVDAVAGLMNTPLFGERFTIGTLLAVPLIALVVLGFLRLFAGG